MRMVFDAIASCFETAENAGKLTRFSTWKPTAFTRRDCYTFEAFASNSDEIHNTYYYLYKRTKACLKEKHPWS